MIALIATYVAISIALFLLTAVFYIAVMKLRDVRDSGELAKLHWSVTVTAYTLLWIGLVLDMLLNWVVMTLVFVELPQEVLTTQRVRRHKFHSTGWRQKVALFFCRNYLTPFDANHCE
jgi:uncharacterized membrane protein YhaH (DUF805 family)